MTTGTIFQIKILGYVKLLCNIELGMCSHVLIFIYRDHFRSINLVLRSTHPFTNSISSHKINW